MADDTKTTGFWQTVPGILTALAAIITAVAGLLIALYQAGLLSSPKSPPPNANSPNAAALVAPTLAQSNPSPGVEKDQLDISGTWHDQEGAVYVFRQDGQHVEFSGNFGNLTYQGNGTLIGRKLTATFSRNDGSYGDSWGTVSADGNVMNGGFRDNFGRTASGRMTRDP
jgi:hypothetical protein